MFVLVCVRGSWTGFLVETLPPIVEGELWALNQQSLPLLDDRSVAAQSALSGLGIKFLLRTCSKIFLLRAFRCLELFTFDFGDSASQEFALVEFSFSLGTLDPNPGPNTSLVAINNSIWNRLN
jgi:hypothetical protein